MKVNVIMAVRQDLQGCSSHKAMMVRKWWHFVQSIHLINKILLALTLEVVRLSIHKYVVDQNNAEDACPEV